jgi:CRISPR-associated protein Csx14
MRGLARLVSLVGRSPGTLHTVLCLLAREGARVGHVTIVATLPDAAEEAERIAQACPCPWTSRPPAEGVPVEKLLLPYQDVTTSSHIRHLRQTIASLLTPDTVLDVTGGRKAMSIAAAIEAAAHGAAIVAAHIPWRSYLETTGATEPCSKTRPEEAVLLRF